ncbi:MAG: enoyl-CoA hydratase-related protein [Bacteroidia bacterium]|nr:enoyl-CoA hydratase-related protein [Bacteroidia bacterium]MDW8159651.1 enoyl-CoA hydratase-related protein [Bacteroidia bacterium]
MLNIDSEKKIATITLNRPEKNNLMNWDFWQGLPHLIEYLNEHKHSIKVAIFQGAGKCFSIGIDFYDMMQHLGPIFQQNSAEGRENLLHLIRQMQKGFLAIHQSPIVFIASIHGYCLGAGLDLASVCDLRIASSDAIFSIRETKMAIVADMGSLSRLPYIIGDTNTRLMAFTGRDFAAHEMQEMGFLNMIIANSEELPQEALYLAYEVSQNSSITLRGIKEVLNYAQEHTFLEGMNFVANWNAAFLDSSDFKEALSAFMQKRKPHFQ